MPKETFHRFTDLPVKLQIEIWEHTLDVEDPCKLRLDDYSFATFPDIINHSFVSFTS